MRQPERVGKIQTVLGLIDADSLGITLTHEHLLTEMSVYYTEPTEATERRLAHEPVSMENLWWVRSHALSNLDNTKLTDEHLAIKEALLYKWAGGNTIVEVSLPGICRDPLGLARISRATGLNIVMGAGYYVGLSHPADLATKTEEEIAEEIVRDITAGVGNTGVRAGIIGEIGCSEPLTETERKVLRASAAAQQRTGAAISVHPSTNDDQTLEILNILSDSSADLSRTIICHVDVWNFKRTTCRKLADAGCYLEYDSLKTNAEIYPPYYFLPRLVERPSNLHVVNDILELIGEGYLNRLLVAHDIAMKHHLVAYGGCGYAHILRDIVPVMQYKGISDDQIQTLLVENPKRVLSLAPSS